MDEAKHSNAPDFVQTFVCVVHGEWGLLLWFVRFSILGERGGGNGRRGDGASVLRLGSVVSRCRLTEIPYPQAKVSHDIVMNVPKKFRVEKGELVCDPNAMSPHKQKDKLKLIQNLYSLKDGGATYQSVISQ